MLTYLIIILSLFLVRIWLFSDSYKKPFISMVLFSPIICSTWKYKISEISLIDIYFALFIGIYLLRIAIKKEKLHRIPYHRFWLVFIFIVVLTSILIFMKTGIEPSLEFFIKSLYIPFCFYICYVYFSGHNDGKALTVSFILAVIFPLIFIFLQKYTGLTWRSHSIRGLTRIQGIYHDITTPRIFVIQALIGLYLYWHYFLDRSRVLKKYILIILSFICFVALYYFYSKAIVLTMILWIALFSFLRKRFYILPVTLCILFIVNSFSNNKLYQDYFAVFSKEVEYLEGDIPSDYVLGGRGRIWKMYLEEWRDLSFIEKAIGAGRETGYFHNDFLRFLFCGGVLLLSYYVFIILLFLNNILRQFLREGRTIHFIALLSIAYYLAESIGQLPGIYPIIHPVTWGIVGLSLNKEVQWQTSDIKS